MDRVIFRKWKSKNGGDIIAILPDQDANPGSIVMYEHIGQHGEGDYYGLLNRTTLATQKEYKDLLQELKRMGYRLKVVSKFMRH